MRRETAKMKSKLINQVSLLYFYECCIFLGYIIYEEGNSQNEKQADKPGVALIFLRVLYISWIYNL